MNRRGPGRGNGLDVRKAGHVGIPIERDIPMPPIQAKNVGPRSDIAIALCKLAVGESFAIPVERAPQLRCIANHWGRRLGRRFSSRSVGEFVRCWRVK